MSQDDNIQAGTVLGYAVFDGDANQIALFFPGDGERDATIHLGSLLGHTGDGPERALSVVKVVAT